MKYTVTWMWKFNCSVVEIRLFRPDTYKDVTRTRRYEKISIASVIFLKRTNVEEISTRVKTWPNIHLFMSHMPQRRLH